MTHVNCGGLITLEQASARWKMSHSTGRVVKSDSEVTIGRCDRCGLAGIVCEPFVAAAVEPELVW